jgi:hypothetical protein
MPRRWTSIALATALAGFAGCTYSNMPTAPPAAGYSGDDVSGGEPATSRRLAEPNVSAPPPDASLGDGEDASADGETDAIAIDAAFDVDGRVPQNHVASAVACPAGRGSIAPYCSLDAGVAPPSLQCVNDSDCTAGANGRCEYTFGSYPLEAGASPTSVLYCTTLCSYDACASNADCASRTPCDCRTSSTDGTANVCLTGSNCAVDSDCGPGGFCSPSAGELVNGGYASGPSQLRYFCHTPNDTCYDDGDCPRCAGCLGGGCEYDTTQAHWACSPAFHAIR